MIKMVKKLNPKAFYTIEDLRKISGSTLMRDQAPECRITQLKNFPEQRKMSSKFLERRIFPLPFLNETIHERRQQDRDQSHNDHNGELIWRKESLFQT